MPLHREVPKNPPEAARSSQLLIGKRSAPISPLESTLPQVLILTNLKSFRINTYKKLEGRVLLVFPPSRPAFTPKVRHPATATSRQPGFLSGSVVSALPASSVLPLSPALSVSSVLRKPCCPHRRPDSLTAPVSAFLTQSPTLSSQSLPTIKFCKPFVLITIQHAGGGGGERCRNESNT
jgi:hypothetical protein